jgi:Rad52/22 family double-strand break repair protein
MGFSAKQLGALRRNLHARQIRTREAHGRELSYIEGWFALSEANRIFGFDGWSRETLDSKCVLARENRGAFTVVYTAKVRITVQADGTTIIREMRRAPATGRGCRKPRVSLVAMWIFPETGVKKSDVRTSPGQNKASA